MRRIAIFCALSMGLYSLNSSAGAKEDFIAAVKEQCKGKSDDDAKKWATSGRKGNVVKFKMCLKPTLELSGDCKIKCKKKGSNFGS